jgi:hypothetical protein
MSNPRNAPTSLPHHLGVAGRACVRACQGSAALSLRTRCVLPAFAALACVFAFAAAPAHAAVTHKLLKQITELPESAPAHEPRTLSGVDDFAVDEGHLWVDEHIEGGTETRRVDEFNGATGAFEEQLEQPPTVRLSTAVGHDLLAVGHATEEREVYAEGAEGSELVVAVFGPSGKLQGTWNGSDSGSVFKESGPSEATVYLTGVAVDANPTSLGGDWAAGDVYVSTEGRNNGTKQHPEEHGGVVDVFRPLKGGGQEFVTRLPDPEPKGTPVPFKGPTGVAIDSSNGDVFVVDNEQVVDVFEPVSGMSGFYRYVFQITGTSDASPFGGKAKAVAVDGSSGDVYVTDGNAVDEFKLAPSGNSARFEGRLAGFHNARGLAVDSEEPHDVYVGDYDSASNLGVIDVYGKDETLPNVAVSEPTGVTPTGAVLHGLVNPLNAGKASCEFEYGTTTEYGGHAKCTREVPDVEAEEPVESLPVEGLAPDTTYHFRLDATNTNGTNTLGPEDLGEFTTPGPGLHQSWSSNVTSSSVELSAKVNPHGVTTGVFFEYGASASYGSSVPVLPGVPIGAGEGDVMVQELIQQGLAPDTTYHYRAVVLSDFEGHPVRFEGPDETFTTQGAGETALPDGRRWEMVSPPEKHGAGIVPIGEGLLGNGTVIQAAADGDAFTYAVESPTESGPQGYTNLQQAFSARGVHSWESHDIPVAHEGPTGASVGYGYEYRLFSEDLSQAVVQPLGAFVPDSSPQALSPQEASEQTAFLRTNYLNGNPTEQCHPPLMHCYRPLATGKEPYANVAPGTVFGIGVELKPCPPISLCGPQFQGATPDLSHVVVSSYVTLARGSATGGGLYEWAEGHLSLLSVLPPDEEGAGGGELGRGEQDTRNAISTDGSRVVWQDGSGALYMRYNATEPSSPVGEGKCEVPTDACTVRLDLVTDGPGGKESPGAVFQDASADGSRVFFTDGQKLTADSGGADLYECAIVTRPSGDLACELTDLTPKSETEESGGVQGVLGVSEDGSYVYFVANRVLTATPDSAGEVAASGAPNLYVSHDGHTILVAVLSNEDNRDWDTNSLNALTARVSPNGGWLAFMSDRSLTGYDNRDANSGEPDEEVYLYDASAGRLVCASCDPSGARPDGVLDQGEPGPLADAERIWGGRWLAADVPGWTPYALSTAVYQSRYLSDNGRLFFNGHDELVPQAVNGTWDVYQWEPPGVGSCTSGSAGFSERSGGCVGLISSGESPEESAFLDASATGGKDSKGEGGGDVFFLTTAQLSKADFDNAYDVYDAHECSTEAPCYPAAGETPPPCVTADGCRAAPTPQPEVFGAPASATFAGPGNLTPPAPMRPAVKKKTIKCLRGKTRNKRNKCVAKKTPRKSAHKSAKGRG